MREREIEANGLRFHVVEDGPADGPLVLLLHGFPEFWYAWRHQLVALGAAGYRAVAPDLRGYNRTEKPPAVADYALDVLAADVVALVRALGATRATLVGHDWGGAIAWHVAARHPEVLDGLVVVASPHPAAVARSLFREIRLLFSAWYLFYFQIPWLPEWRIVRDGVGAGLRRAAARPRAFADEDIARYDEAARVPGAMRAAVNYYRAALRGARATAKQASTVRAPTLVVWGERDAAWFPVLDEALDGLVTGPLRVEILPDVGHFVSQEDPEAFNALLLGFLARP